MERPSHSGPLVQSNLASLPVEVLVYIVSFLSTRDKVIIRCVSKSLRSVSEVSSLWEKFVWTCYAPRDERIIKLVSKIFGKHIKTYHFADHVAPSKLEVMLKYCKNVVHLSLPSFNYYINFKKLKTIVHGMASLQVLNIPLPWGRTMIREIFTLFSNLKELSLHYAFGVELYCKQCAEEWANFNYVPRNLNIIFVDKPGCPNLFISSLQSCLPWLRNNKLSNLSGSSDIARFNICFNQSSAVPYIQLQVTESIVTLPSVKASKYGLLGLDVDTLHLTQGNGNVHKALLIGGIDEYVDSSIASLTSVTHFDASHCGGLYPGHLEQLSIACPNLKKLDLCGNSSCLNNLQGLHGLANNCKNLQALNLRKIYVHNCEYNCVQLWEILCAINLTQLAIEAWMININIIRDSSLPSSLSGGQSAAVKQPGFITMAISQGLHPVAVNKHRLITMFQKYLTLQVLEVEIVVSAGSCNNLSDNELLLISYFPSITSYRLCNLPKNNCCYTLKRIFICRYLRCLFLSKSLRGIITLSLERHCSCLQQLYIDSRDTVPTDAFIDALCGHGGLEHVILRVKSLSARSIGSIIEHSYNLVTFDVTLYSRAFLKAQLKQLVIAIKTKFSKRKLVNGGTFNVRQCSASNKERLMHNTDLLSVWDSD